MSLHAPFQHSGPTTRSGPKDSSQPIDGVEYSPTDLHLIDMQSQNQSISLGNETSGINSRGVAESIILVVEENGESRAGIGAGNADHPAHLIAKIHWIIRFFRSRVSIYSTVIFVIITHIIRGVFLWLPEVYKNSFADLALTSHEIRGSGGGGTPVVDNGHTVIIRWRARTRNFVPHWHMMQFAAGATITASITFEQIQGIDSNPWTRTSAIMSAICAFASFMLSSGFIVGYKKLCGQKATGRWVKASVRNSGVCDKYWFFLALPLVWLSWSVILLFATILLHAWINNPVQLQGTLQELKRRHVNGTSAINIVSPLSITMLSVIMVVQMFFVWREFLGLDQADVELDDIPVAQPA